MKKVLKQVVVDLHLRVRANWFSLIDISDIPPYQEAGDELNSGTMQAPGILGWTNAKVPEGTWQTAKSENERHHFRCEKKTGRIISVFNF